MGGNFKLVNLLNLLNLVNLLKLLNLCIFINISSLHKGYHKGGWAAEGRPPPLWGQPKAAPFMEA